MIVQFKKYLLQKKYRASTVHGHVLNMGHFMQWIERSPLREEGIENTRYNDLLSYVQYEQERNLDTATINLRLNSISKYFVFLKHKNILDKNPAATLRIKGKAKTVIQSPLSWEQLEALYHGYRSLQKETHVQHKTDIAHQRDIVITGLLVWQGLHSGELQRLETNHINLHNGTIYIPSTVRSNSRQLQLHTQQVLPLHTYLYGGIRGKLQPKGEELITGNAHNIINRLTEELKGINPQIKNALHIRASVILHWLRQHDKRQVQYMAGHKHISSIEKYAVQELSTLTDALSKHHPFG